MNTSYTHQPVLSQAVLTALMLAPNGYYIDATFGRGGHSSAILAALGPQGRLLALDQDPAAVAAAQHLPLAADPRFTLIHSSFTDLGRWVADYGWQQQVQGIILDLGVSSPQLDDPSRGFSFRHDGPLDMRMNPTVGLTAAEWLAEATFDEIKRVLWQLGEERYAVRVAAAILAAQEQTPLVTTHQLASVIERAIPARAKQPGKHPATQSFQAIRLFINQELAALEAVLPQCLAALRPGGRFAVISFHSLEDRLVKRFIASQTGSQLPKDIPLPDKAIPRQLRPIGRLVRPDSDEVSRNPRARSARLRIAEKYGC